MNTPTPAQALGEVLKLSENAHAGELEAVIADGAIPCVGLTVADDSGGMGFLVAEGWSLDDCKFAAASMNLARQHGQHFAGLSTKLQAERSLRIEQQQRAEAAEARVREAEGLLREAADYLPHELSRRVDAFLAANGVCGGNEN